MPEIDRYQGSYSAAALFRRRSAKAQWPRIESLWLLIKRDAGFTIAKGERER
jgi:hypothetical protein